MNWPGSWVWTASCPAKLWSQESRAALALKSQSQSIKQPYKFRLSQLRGPAALGNCNYLTILKLGSATMQFIFWLRPFLSWPVTDSKWQGFLTVAEASISSIAERAPTFISIFSAAPNRHLASFPPKWYTSQLMAGFPCCLKACGFKWTIVPGLHPRQGQAL